MFKGVSKVVASGQVQNSNSPSSLPTFSTPGFGKGKFKAVNQDTPISIPTSSSSLSAVSVSSAHAIKRSSSDICPPSPRRPSPRSKKAKTNQYDDKENDPDELPVNSPRPQRKVIRVQSNTERARNWQDYSFDGGASTSKVKVTAKKAEEHTVAATPDPKLVEDNAELADFSANDWFSGLQEVRPSSVL